MAKPQFVAPLVLLVGITPVFIMNEYIGEVPLSH